MTQKTYPIDSECLELFLIVAEYSENKSVDATMAKLKEFANQGRASTGNGIEYTDDKINELFDGARRRRSDHEQRQSFSNNVAKIGGVAIAATGVIGLVVVGNIASIPYIVGSLVAMGIGAGLATQVKFSAEMPNTVKFEFSSLNETYGKPFAELDDKKKK